MVSSDRSKVVAVATVGPALLLALVMLWQWRSTTCTFREAGPGTGLFVCRQRVLGPYTLQPALVRVQRHEGWLWACRQVDHWVLIDAGTRDSLLLGAHASSLVRAIKRALRPVRRGGDPGRLELVVLTHAHTVGALPRLLQTYPDTKVVAHEGEQPFLLGDPPSPYYNFSSHAPLQLRAANALGLLPSLETGIPRERLLVLQGQAGDLADATPAAATAVGRAIKKPLRWLPRGVLSFVHVPGHTPGSIAVVHNPSGAMLAGDAVAPARRWLGGAATSLTAAPGPDAAVQQAAAKKLISQAGFQWLLPAHGGNFSVQQAQELVQGWPDEVPEHKAQGEEAEAAGQGGQEEGLHRATRDIISQEDALDTAAAGLGLSPHKGPQAGGSGGGGEHKSRGRSGLGAAGEEAGSGGSGGEF